MDRGSEQFDIVVIVEQHYSNRLDEVATGLRQAGMRIDSILSAVGMICGAVAGDKQQSLNDVPGAKDVERSDPFGVG